VKKALDQSIVHIFRRNVTSAKAMRLKNPAAPGLAGRPSDAFLVQLSCDRTRAQSRGKVAKDGLAKDTKTAETLEDISFKAPAKRRLLCCSGQRHLFQSPEHPPWCTGGANP
jgi:hypothetical protein